MKKRAMKKWIPKGAYCHGSFGKEGQRKNPKCKWLKYITTIKKDKSNCVCATDCNEICWSKPSNSCRDIVYKCEYLSYIDWTQESLLWDACKECGIKDE